MTIYIDSDCKCHATNDGTMQEFDAPFFDGKCNKFIEGYKCISSESQDVYTPWKDYNELYRAQLEYEIEQYKAALIEIETALGVTSE